MAFLNSPSLHLDKTCFFSPYSSFHSLLSPFDMSHSLVIFLTSLSCCFIGGFFQLFKWSVGRIGRSLVAVRVIASFSKEYFSYHFSWKYRVDQIDYFRYGILHSNTYIQHPCSPVYTSEERILIQICILLTFFSFAQIAPDGPLKDHGHRKSLVLIIPGDLHSSTVVFLSLTIIECCWCCSAAQSCWSLCDPMHCSTPGFPVLHRLLELALTHVY